MRAIRLHQVGGSEALLYEDALKPSPKDNQVLVRVYATAITPILLTALPGRFPLFSATNSPVSSTRSDKLAWVSRLEILSMA
jgi:NADPH:quinone reductase-like Zn-dependent oxidoreductase